MTPTISAERYIEIRTKVERRNVDALVTEIAATYWAEQRRFSSLDEFNFADTLAEQADNASRRSQKRL